MPDDQVTEPERTEWPTVGDVDICEASIGARGHGKSTHQCVRVFELWREMGGAYVIGHSFGQRLPARLPPRVYGGAELPITYHRSIDQLQKGIARHPNRWHIIGPPMKEEDPQPHLPRSSADDLLKYAMRLSRSIRERAWKKAHPGRALFTAGHKMKFDGLRCPPIIVIIDEGIAVGAAAAGDRGQRQDNDWFKEFLFSLRHCHIVLLYAIQEPTARSWRVIEQSTAIHVFKLRHEWALNAVRAAGASMEQLEEIRALQKYEHVTLR